MALFRKDYHPLDSRNPNNIEQVEAIKQKRDLHIRSEQPQIQTEVSRPERAEKRKAPWGKAQTSTAEEARLAKIHHAAMLRTLEAQGVGVTPNSQSDVRLYKKKTHPVRKALNGIGFVFQLIRYARLIFVIIFIAYLVIAKGNADRFLPSGDRIPVTPQLIK